MAGRPAISFHEFYSGGKLALALTETPARTEDWAVHTVGAGGQLIDLGGRPVVIYPGAEDLIFAIGTSLLEE